MSIRIRTKLGAIVTLAEARESFLRARCLVSPGTRPDWALDYADYILDALEGALTVKRIPGLVAEHGAGFNDAIDEVYDAAGVIEEPAS